jgi:hypothetical protein
MCKACSRKLEPDQPDDPDTVGLLDNVKKLILNENEKNVESKFDTLLFNLKKEMISTNLNTSRENLELILEISSNDEYTLMFISSPPDQLNYFECETRLNTILSRLKSYKRHLNIFRGHLSSLTAKQAQVSQDEMLEYDWLVQKFQYDIFSLSVSVIDDRLLSLSIQIRYIKQKLFTNPQVISETNLFNHFKELTQLVDAEMAEYFESKSLNLNGFKKTQTSRFATRNKNRFKENAWRRLTR